MCDQEFNYDESFKSLKKKELVELLKQSHKRELDQQLRHHIEIAQMDVEILQHIWLNFDKNQEIKRLTESSELKNFWFKMSVFLGVLLCLSIVISISKTI